MDYRYVEAMPSPTIIPKMAFNGVLHHPAFIAIDPSQDSAKKIHHIVGAAFWIEIATAADRAIRKKETKEKKMERQAEQKIAEREEKKAKEVLRQQQIQERQIRAANLESKRKAAHEPKRLRSANNAHRNPARMRVSQHKKTKKRKRKTETETETTTVTNDGGWSTKENELFEKAVINLGYYNPDNATWTSTSEKKNWKLVADDVGTRTATQCRTHGQKWILKQQRLQKKKLQQKKRQKLQ